jgi:hypothetical protein
MFQVQPADEFGSYSAITIIYFPKQLFHSSLESASEKRMSVRSTSPDRPSSVVFSSSSPRSSTPLLAHLPTRPSPLSTTPPIGRSISASIAFSGDTHAVPPDMGLQSALKRVARGSLGGGLGTVGSGAGKLKVLGIQDKLRKELDGVIKRRTGGVLGRG